jgi:hypothetical protein
MRQAILLLAMTVIIGAGCATSSGDGAPVSTARSGETTSDGLMRVETDRRGDLFLREDHGIGGYDAIVVAPSFVNYKRSSDRLDPNVEVAYLAASEQAVMDAAEEAGAPIVNVPGPCTIAIGVGFLNVELARSDTADVLGEMVFVIQYQDSVSGQALLRYVEPQRIERESGGTSREQQIRNSFDRMIEEVDVTSALRAATGTPSGPRSGCEGALLKVGLPAE